MTALAPVEVGVKKETTTKTGGARKGPPEPLVLFSPAGSLNLFIRELRTAGGNAGLPITFEATFHIRLNAMPILGAPEAAGGCGVVLDDDYINGLASAPVAERGVPSVKFRRIAQTEPEILLEPIEDARKRFIQWVKTQGNYGLKFAFLNEAKSAEPLLMRMREQAAREGRVQMEAQLVLAEQAGIMSPGVPLDTVLANEKVAAAKAAAGAAGA